MIAGKARKNIDRVFSNKKIKLTKCEVILGANASGKSNLVSAFQFAQSVIVDGLPRGFSNKFFRLMFSDFLELQVLRNIFEWFSDRLNISFPDSILTGYLTITLSMEKAA